MKLMEVRSEETLRCLIMSVTLRAFLYFKLIQLLYCIHCTIFRDISLSSSCDVNFTQVRHIKSVINIIKKYYELTQIVCIHIFPTTIVILLIFSNILILILSIDEANFKLHFFSESLLIGHHYFATLRTATGSSRQSGKFDKNIYM